jgi:hypothetical protein
MAIYHLHLGIITRGKGKSAVAAAADRSGTNLTNEYDGEVHDFTHKGGLVHTEIILPANAPPEFADRSTLWNSVEKVERYKTAQLAREVELAFPYELTAEQNLSLVRKYVTENFVNAGMCADICIHDPDRNTPNPHAHIMLTMRPLNEDKSWGAKLKTVGGKTVYTTDWNDRARAEEWRAAWAKAVNDELERIGSSERIDHRSYQRQGINQIPTVHLGVSATQMERRGIVTDRGNINRDIAVSNSQLKQTRARIERLYKWTDEVKSKTPPTLYDVITSLLDNPDKSKLTNLKIAAEMLDFMLVNNVRTLPALADKVAVIRQDFNRIRNDMKAADKRLKTLGTHIEKCKNFTEHRGVNAGYQAKLAAAQTAAKETGFFAKSKAEKARQEAQDFYETHRSEIDIYRSAEKYLRDTLQSRFDPKKVKAQQKKWEDEITAKQAEQHKLYSDYHKLTDELKEAETLKRFAIKLMIPDEPQERQ